MPKSDAHVREKSHYAKCQRTKSDNNAAKMPFQTHIFWANKKPAPGGQTVEDKLQWLIEAMPKDECFDSYKKDSSGPTSPLDRRVASILPACKQT